MALVIRAETKKPAERKFRKQPADAKDRSPMCAGRSMQAGGSAFCKRRQDSDFLLQFVRTIHPLKKRKSMGSEGNSQTRKMCCSADQARKETVYRNMHAV